MCCLLQDDPTCCVLLEHALLLRLPAHSKTATQVFGRQQEGESGDAAARHAGCFCAGLLHQHSKVGLTEPKIQSSHKAGMHECLQLSLHARLLCNWAMQAWCAAYVLLQANCVMGVCPAHPLRTPLLLSMKGWSKTCTMLPAVLSCNHSSLRVGAEQASGAIPIPTCLSPLHGC